jgi:hypothetical protein
VWCRFHAARALVLTRLWAKTPCPHRVRAPLMPVRCVRFQRSSFEMVDPSFGSGSPFDLVAESSPMLELAAGSARFAYPRDGYGAYAQPVQVAFDGGQSVAAVSGHRPWWAAGAASDPLDRWRQLRCISRVSTLDGVSRITASALSTTCAL